MSGKIDQNPGAVLAQLWRTNVGDEIVNPWPGQKTEQKPIQKLEDVVEPWARPPERVKASQSKGAQAAKKSAESDKKERAEQRQEHHRASEGHGLINDPWKRLPPEPSSKEKLPGSGLDG